MGGEEISTQGSEHGNLSTVRKREIEREMEGGRRKREREKGERK